MQATTRFREAREPRATGATLATPVKAFPVPVSTSPRQRRVGLVLSALPVLFLAGHHHFMKYLVKLADHVGRLLASVGLNPVRERWM